MHVRVLVCCLSARATNDTAKRSPSTFHGVDKRGCPIYVERVGAFDATGLLASIDIEDLKTHHIFQLERGERLKREAGIKLQNKPFKKHLAIEDLGGLGWGHMTSACGELHQAGGWCCFVLL